MCHILGFVCHIFCRIPLILTDFLCHTDPHCMAYFGGIYFVNMGGGGGQNYFQHRPSAEQVFRKATRNLKRNFRNVLRNLPRNLTPRCAPKISEYPVLSWQVEKSSPQIQKAPDTFNFLRHVLRAIWSVRPKCSHRRVFLKETPLKPVQSLKRTTENSAEQTVMRTKWFKHIAI